jgi:hypothetical protein
MTILDDFWYGKDMVNFLKNINFWKGTLQPYNMRIWSIGFLNWIPTLVIILKAENKSWFDLKYINSIFGIFPGGLSELLFLKKSN